MTGPTRRERPEVPKDYGLPDDDAGLLEWSWAEERLAGAMNYWIATVRRDGRPHATPVWGVWHEGALFFDGSGETRRMKNIAANPEVSVHLESGDEVVILEGRAESAPVPPDRAFAAQLAGLYTAKYAAHEYAPEPDQWDEGGLYVVRPRKVIGWMLKPGIVFGTTYTRWRFDES